MVHDPRRDSRAQRAQQLVGRSGGQLHPTREAQEAMRQQMALETPVIDVPEDALVMPPDFARGDRFFDEVEMGDVVEGQAGGGIPPGSGTINPMEWNEEHPLWLAFKKGQVRMATLPDGSVHIIDKREDVDESINDLLPRQMFSKGDFVQGDRVASLAQLQYRLGKTMVSYGLCPFVSAGSPLATRPAQASTLVPPVGGAVLCGLLDFGFEGAGEQVVFDIPAGTVVKIPFAGNFGKLTARLWPKYWTPSDDGVAKVRTYLFSPGGPALTSELWNSILSNVMAQNNFDNPNAQDVRGWISEGIISNDLPRAPTRRFYGSVKCTGTIAEWHTICPVAFAASHVTLVGGAYDVANPALKSLQFLFILQPTGGVAAPTMGPFDIDQTVAIPNGCVGISVFNSPNVVGAIGASLEVLFELIFSLSP